MSSSDSHEDKHFTVNRILSKRMRPAQHGQPPRVEYFVQWQWRPDCGWSLDECDEFTWEPRESFASKKLIRRFEKRYKDLFGDAPDKFIYMKHQVTQTKPENRGPTSDDEQWDADEGRWRDEDEEDESSDDETSDGTGSQCDKDQSDESNEVSSTTESESGNDGGESESESDSGIEKEKKYSERKHHKSENRVSIRHRKNGSAVWDKKLRPKKKSHEERVRHRKLKDLRDLRARVAKKRASRSASVENGRKMGENFDVAKENNNDDVTVIYESSSIKKINGEKCKPTKCAIAKTHNHSKESRTAERPSTSILKDEKKRHFDKKQRMPPPIRPVQKKNDSPPAPSSKSMSFADALSGCDGKKSPVAKQTLKATRKLKAMKLSHDDYDMVEARKTFRNNCFNTVSILGRPLFNDPEKIGKTTSAFNQMKAVNWDEGQIDPDSIAEICSLDAIIPTVSFSSRNSVVTCELLLKNGEKVTAMLPLFTLYALSPEAYEEAVGIFEATTGRKLADRN